MWHPSLRNWINKPALFEQSDGELLSRFLAARDETAFAAFVRRYERMVLDVCWRVLHHWQDAEAAFQNTFLVLVRKAASIREMERIGSWLHRAAWYEAMNVRKKRRRRQDHEVPCGLAQLAQLRDQAEFRELRTLLDMEVQRLPEKYRVPFVLCCLESKSKAEVAQKLGWKEGTVSSRLAKARKLMRQRLGGYGIAPS